MSEYTFRNEWGDEVRLAVTGTKDNAVVIVLDARGTDFEGKPTGLHEDMTLSTIEAGALHRLLNELLS
jgi:hypothetical protein